MTTVRGKIKTKRFCLKCQQPFSSEGSHNRLCFNCREDNMLLASGSLLPKSPPPYLSETPR